MTLIHSGSRSAWSLQIIFFIRTLCILHRRCKLGSVQLSVVIASWTLSLFISFSRIAIVLAKVSMTSGSDFAKSTCSFAQKGMAAFKSASVVANTSCEITDLGLEGVAGSSELDPTRLQIGLHLTSRFHGKCQLARLRLAPSNEFFVNSVTLQTFDLDLRLQI